jgi:hypothetical protein
MPIRLIGKRSGLERCFDQKQAKVSPAHSIWDYLLASSTALVRLPLWRLPAGPLFPPIFCAAILVRFQLLIPMTIDVSRCKQHYCFRLRRRSCRSLGYALEKRR